MSRNLAAAQSATDRALAALYAGDTNGALTSLDQAVALLRPPVAEIAEVMEEARAAGNFTAYAALARIQSQTPPAPPEEPAPAPVSPPAPKPPAKKARR